MDWNRFDPHGTDRDAAFEAFAGQLFERWCRRTYGDALHDVRFVRGDGGDGGVEAYAVLGSGEEIGLQAKWFRKELGKKQIEQIEGSLRAAVANHPRLRRYLVAIPRKLTDTRAAGATTTKKRPETTERARWEAWKSTKAAVIAPAAEIVLWDEAALEAQLGERDNAGLDAYWFPGSTIPPDYLERRFKAACAGWLRPRYFPDLHAVGHLERDLDLRLGEPKARETLRREVEGAVEDLAAVRDDVARLVRYADFVKKVDEPRARSQAACSALEKLIDAGDTLAQTLRSGRPVREPIAFGVGDENALRDLDNALRSLGERHDPIGEIREQMHRVLWEHDTPLTILHAWKRWQRAPNLVAFVGPPGIGKTHGLAHAVDKQLACEQPALLIRARDCPLDGGWEEILRRALDVPGQPLPALLNALEAAAVRAEVWRARASSGTGEAAPGPSYFLIAIDGLEESSDHQRWAEPWGSFRRISHDTRASGPR